MFFLLMALCSAILVWIASHFMDVFTAGILVNALILLLTALLWLTGAKQALDGHTEQMLVQMGAQVEAYAGLNPWEVYLHALRGLGDMAESWLGF